MRGIIPVLIALSIIISGCVDQDSPEPLQPEPEPDQTEPIQDTREPKLQQSLPIT